MPIILKTVGADILVAMSAFGFGTWILPILPSSFSKVIKSVCVGIGGFGILGSVLFLIGQISFHRSTVALVLAIGVGSAVVRRSHFYGLVVRISKIPAAILFSVLLLTAVAGLAEPVGDWGTDGIAYHFVGPKVWLRQGVIRPIPDNAPTSYPCLVETVFGALRATGGDRAPGFSAFWTLGLLLAVSAALASRCGLGTQETWWVTALLSTMGALYEGSHSGFVDAVYAAFILCAILVGLDAKERKNFVAVGLFCGFAMATKYPGLLATPVVVLCVVWPSNFSSIRRGIADALIAITIAGIVASPIYSRNWILLGSPIYPPPARMSEFFSVKYYSAPGLKAFYDWCIRRGNGLGRGPLSFLLLPYNLTYHTANFNGAGGIGLAPLALGWLGVLVSWCYSFARRFAIIGALLLVLWFCTMQESRYLIHVYAISAVFAVLGWKWVVMFIGRRGQALCAIAVAISLLYGLVLITKSRIPDLHSVFSASYARHRRETEIPYVESFDYINSDPAVTRLLILDPSVPAYYSNKDYVKPLGQWGELLYQDATTPSEVLSKIAVIRPSHILDVKSKISDFCIPQNSPGLMILLDRPDQKVYKVVRQ